MKRCATAWFGLLLACTGSDATLGDAGLDASSAIAAPAPPSFSPCPSGWREVADDRGVVTCDPWPSTGYDEHCAADSAHWPGSSGCTRIGTACAADGWPSDLPSDRPTVFVDDDAAPGGDGSSRSRALTHIVDATIFAPSGAVIAVATGRYDETIVLGEGQTLWGACVASTFVTISTSAPSGLIQLVTGSGVRNLTVQDPATAGIVSMSATGASVEDVVVSGARAYGLYANGGSLTATHVLVRGTVSQADGRFGQGLHLEPGTSVTLSFVSFDGNRDDGIVAVGPLTTIDASDLVVRGTLAATTGLAGRGIDLSAGVRLTLARSVLEANHEMGLFGDGAATIIDASDLVVRGTLARSSDGLIGRGIGLQNGATLTLSRTSIEANRNVGLLADGAGTMVSARDLVVRGTLSQDADHLFGRGVAVEAGAHLTLSRALIAANHELGILVSGDGTTLDASDLVVRETLPQTSDGALGAGLWTQFGAVTHVAVARVESSSMAGIVSTEGASVSLSDVVVSSVIASACPSDFCVGTSGGFGVAAIYGGSLSALRFGVEDATLCGAMVGSEGTSGPSALDLASGVVERSPVGACVQVDGYDTDRLHHDVQYRDVGVPLQATSYALPMSIAPGT